MNEQRKKSKITLNPRGTLWLNDENKIGKKLLEKMGWSNGKGLGKEEQGIKYPIHVSGNSENKGIGFSGKTDLSSQHYENFEDVLSSLNSANNSESSNSELEDDSNHLKNVESLEMKSKNSRARVHYSKFTRGKDLSRYNENDLACVLGTKKILKRKAKNEMSKNQNEDIMEDVNSEDLSNANQQFTTGGNLKDYFNQKMDELKRKRNEGLLGDEETPKRAKKESASQPETPFPNLDFEPEKSNFSFNISVQEDDVKLESSTDTASYPETEEKNEEEAAEKIVEKKKKRKKSKKNKDIENECPEEKNHNEITEENCTGETERKEKKTRKKFKSDDDEEIHSSEKESKMKKKKKHIKEKDYDFSSKSIEPEQENHNEVTEENNTGETEREEKKTRRKFKSDDDEEIHSSEKESMKKKKKKKKHTNEEEYDSSCKSIEPQRHGDSELFVEDERQSHGCNMNESYVKATSTAEKNKNKKQKEGYEETSEEKENVSSKPLKKLRKLASEISLPEILKSSSEKIENENNVNCELENEANVYKKTEEEKANPKVKLKSKRSFKELKTDLEARVKEKIKKISKSELVPIEEETVIEENKREKSKTKGSKIVNLEIPVGYDNGDYMKSAPNQYKTVQFDIEKKFPNSNLEKIKGYFKT